MKKQHTDTTDPARVVAVAGDDALTHALIPLLGEKGFTVLASPDKRMLHSEGASIVAAFELTLTDAAVKQERLALFDDALPPAAVLFSTSVCVSAIEQASWLAHPERLVGISAFPTLMGGRLVECALTIHTKKSTVTAARSLAAGLDKELVIVQDRVGMIFPGILAQVINEALFVVQQNVASPEDVDTAMKAGAGYPMGPIEWGEKIGFPAIVGLLDAMRADTGEERYRVAPLLRQLSRSGKFWSAKVLTPEPVQEVLPLGDVPQQKKKTAKKKH